MKPTAPTLLIGLDGATFTVLDPYIEDGVMPFLGSLMRDGTRGVLRSIMPPLTPPAWTSLVTGKHPGQHGVFDFFQKDEPGSIYFSFASSQNVRTATIWSLASEQDRRVIALNFPLMFPAPPVNGAVVPGGMMPWRQLRLGCHPPGLFQRLQQLDAFEPREMLDMELEVKAIDGCPEEEYADWVELHIRREKRWAAVLRYLMAEEPADLIAILFDGVDKLQHLCWRFIDPACRPANPTDWEQHMIDLCASYFRSLDGLLAEIVADAGPDATVVITSDHGFGPTQDVFHVNSWLEREGYLFWTSEEERAKKREATDVGFAEMTRHVHAIDWTRTVAYAATPVEPGDPHRREDPRDRGPDARGRSREDRGRAGRGADGPAPPERRRCRWSKRCGPASRHSRARSRRSARTCRWCSPTAARCRSCHPTRSSRGATQPRVTTAGRASFIAKGPGIRARRRGR